MRELRTEIEISAPPRKVWEILTDFAGWPRWNPIVNQAKGAASPGAKLRITTRGKDGKDGVNYQPTITSLEKPRLLRWHGAMMTRLLFSNDKVVELEETASGTRLIHREEFDGVLVPLFWSKLGKNTVPMLESMNQALKMEAEERTD